ncbi:MAG: hypothetical protein JOZ51_21885 [Chloroflexi bacterium]|nr:hypothetical protein [Chloroflexota bacterium]
MERTRAMRRSEAALEQLLQRIDHAVDEYARSRRARRVVGDRWRSDDLRPDEDAVVEPHADDWAAWWSLPLAIRDWLLGYVPAWWSLSPLVLRRFLLTTARLIVWRRLSPRLALRRAALRLRLPPPRPRTRAARVAARSAIREFRAAAQRDRQRVGSAPRRSLASRSRTRRPVPVSAVRRRIPLRRASRGVRTRFR